MGRRAHWRDRGDSLQLGKLMTPALTGTRLTCAVNFALIACRGL